MEYAKVTNARDDGTQQLRELAHVADRFVDLLQAIVDAPLALVIVGLGILIVIGPSSVPGLTPPM